MFKVIYLLFFSSIFASEAAHRELYFNLYYLIPFIGILLSIANLPLLYHQFWDKHFGKISFFWAMSFIIPFYISTNNATIVITELLHVLLLEYFPFIILLLALFTVAGGISIEGDLVATPKVNLFFLLQI